MPSTPTNKLRAAEISSELQDFLLQQKQPGKVHSVFHSSVNLLLDGQLITLLAESRPLYPYSVRLTGEMLPPLFPEAPFLIQGSTILFPTLSWEIDLSSAKSTCLSLGSLGSGCLHSPDPQRMRELKGCILHHGKPDGFAPLLCLLEQEDSVDIPSNLYADFAAKRIPALFDAVRSLDIKSAGAAAYSIAGCGIGLTPSADDFLCGLMASLRMESIARQEESRLHPLLWEMAQAAVPRTNLISGTFLREVGCGLVSQDVQQLMKALYSSVLSQEVLSSAMNVIAFGETSGTDILTGIYFGQKIYPN